MRVPCRDGVYVRGGVTPVTGTGWGGNGGVVCAEERGWTRRGFTSAESGQTLSKSFESVARPSSCKLG